ncbi:MAG: hypothetical protein ACLGPL_06070, partial [Acidobacteriota bacterium]
PPAVCPGPNLAYFSGRSFSLKEMVDHIYGRTNLLNNLYRPNMFMSELKMYIDYLDLEIRESLKSMNDQRIKYFNDFKSNLTNGISYYEGLMPKMIEQSRDYLDNMKNDLKQCQDDLDALISRYTDVFA